MGLTIKKQERETTQALIRRFTEGMKKSGILIRARKLRFRTRGKSPNMQKKAALRKVELRKEYAKLKKLGKIIPKTRRR